MTDLLLVEDDDQLRRALALTLRSRGYHVVEAPDGAAALASLGRQRPDLVILDLGLPDLDGVEVLRHLRSDDVATPVMVLSARRDQGDKVTALDAGADDYLTKPFGLDELLARIRAALRRAGGPAESVVVRTDAFTVDLGRKTVMRADGEDVHLTPTEWGILESLVRAGGMLVPGPELLREVWGPQYETQGNYLRVYLAQLRRKLERDPAHPQHLITVPGVGYRFDVSSSG